MDFKDNEEARLTLGDIPFIFDGTYFVNVDDLVFKNEILQEVYEDNQLFFL